MKDKKRGQYLFKNYYLNLQKCNKINIFFKTFVSTYPTVGYFQFLHLISLPWQYNVFNNL